MKKGELQDKNGEKPTEVKPIKVTKPVTTCRRPSVESCAGSHPRPSPSAPRNYYTTLRTKTFMEQEEKAMHEFVDGLNVVKIDPLAMLFHNNKGKLSSCIKYVVIYRINKEV